MFDAAGGSPGLGHSRRGTFAQACRPAAGWNSVAVPARAGAGLGGSDQPSCTDPFDPGRNRRTASRLYEPQPALNRAAGAPSLGGHEITASEAEK